MLKSREYPWDYLIIRAFREDFSHSFALVIADGSKWSCIRDISKYTSWWHPTAARTATSDFPHPYTHHSPIQPSCTNPTIPHGTTSNSLHPHSSPLQIHSHAYTHHHTAGPLGIPHTHTHHLPYIPIPTPQKLKMILQLVLQLKPCYDLYFI